MALPAVCFFGGLVFAHTGLQQSVSSYYHTNMRDFLVGLLGCVAIFLFSYKGDRLIDNLVTLLAGVAGAGVAIFPCPTTGSPDMPIGIFQLPQHTSGDIHIICAGAFFILLAVNSFFLFVFNKKPVTRQKKMRNAVYIICGSIIMACMIFLIVIWKAAPDFLANTSIGFAMETTMLATFGISWLVKGQTLFREKPANE
jgi:hypothetical protein